MTTVTADWGVRRWNGGGMVTRRDLRAGALAAAGSSVRGGASKPRDHRYLHYDVFTERPLTGNQLAVFTEPTDLAAGDMARFAIVSCPPARQDT
jgi:hypothetical protein